MLCGTPVIAFNKGSMPELIKHGVTGFLVNDINEAIEAVDSIDTIKRVDCHHWANQNFSCDKMVDDYVEVYKKIIEATSK